jgi:hypothetical protein
MTGDDVDSGLLLVTRPNENLNSQRKHDLTIQHKQPLSAAPCNKRVLGTHMISDPKMPHSQTVRQNAVRFQPLAQSQRYATSSGLLCRTAHTGCIMYGHWPHPFSDSPCLSSPLANRGSVCTPTEVLCQHANRGGGALPRRDAGTPTPPLPLSGSL